MTRNGEANLRERVFRTLATVTDPELDQPITDLGFVKGIAIKDSTISVDIVTSTFWCPPNFVYMMLEDARAALSRLAGVRKVRVNLEGHHDAARINEAINSGKSFSQCYGSEANGDLVELNRIFREKALRGRLYAMATALGKRGIATGDLLGLKLEDVVPEHDSFTVKSGGTSLRVTDPEDVQRIARYLSFLNGLGIEDGPLVIWDLAGSPPDRDEIDSFLSRSRSTMANLGLNAELCRALLSARIGPDRA